MLTLKNLVKLPQLGVLTYGLRDSKRGGKNFFPHPNELLIWAYPENLVKIGLLVEAVDTFCWTGMAWHGHGGHIVII